MLKAIGGQGETSQILLSGLHENLNFLTPADGKPVNHSKLSLLFWVPKTIVNNLKIIQISSLSGVKDISRKLLDVEVYKICWFHQYLANAYYQPTLCIEQ